MLKFGLSLALAFIGFNLFAASSPENLKIYNDDPKGVFHRLIRDGDLDGIKQLFTLYESLHK